MITLISIFSLLACSGGESNFTNNSDQGTSEQGVADMTYSHESMVFTDLDWEQGISSGQDFLVTNIGDNNLSIYTLDIADSGGGAFFVQEENDLILAAGNERTFIVVATLYEEVTAVGQLRVKSNDADARDLRIPLCAFPIGYKGDISCSLDDEGGDSGR
jgi:hypothetical protein